MEVGKDIDEAELKSGKDVARFALRAACNKKLPLEATLINRDCKCDIDKDKREL
ncbi:MAG: hypothetical protein L6V85_08270 [Clostridiales bacterium]|nr:MAG: hypothetical protein L6V85_08270 [Clostridiales bacterium]